LFQALTDATGKTLSRTQRRSCRSNVNSKTPNRVAVGGEPRKLIAIRLDAEVLEWLRKTAEKRAALYQSLVNEILASEMRKAS
jgi:uncharacterized protein (DUF4415 family)